MYELITDLSQGDTMHKKPFSRSRLVSFWWPYRASFLTLVLFCLGSGGNPKMVSENFLWGAAFSAHQSEGATGGGEHGDWYQFEHRATSPIYNRDNADQAVDFWNRYAEDIQVA